MATPKKVYEKTRKSGGVTTFEILKPSSHSSLKVDGGCSQVEKVLEGMSPPNDDGGNVSYFMYGWQTWGDYGPWSPSDFSSDDEEPDQEKSDHYFVEREEIKAPLISDSSLAKQLIQETITRNASPVLDGMVIPGSSSSPSSVGGAGGDLLSEISGVDDAELALKRMQLQTVANRVEGSVSSHGSKLGDHSPHHSSHFSYTVTLGEHQIKILGDDLQYVQEAKMALDDYFLQKYPDLFCANLNGIEEDDQEEMEEEDEEDDDEDFHDTCLQRYDRETLLNLSKVRTPPPDFSHLEPDIRGNIVLEKPRQFDLDKFSRETVGLATGTGSSTPMVSAPSSTPSTPSTPTATCNVGTLAAAAAVAAAVQAASTSNNNNGSGSGSKTADVLPG